MTLAVIPARGGSQGLKRKNLLPNSAGIPLFLVSARAARDAGCQVVVSTDDTEIATVAGADGFAVHRRGVELADVPVDNVVSVSSNGSCVKPNTTTGPTPPTPNLPCWG